MEIKYYKNSTFEVQVYLDSCLIDNIIIYNLFEPEPNEFFGCVIEDFLSLDKKLSKTDFGSAEKTVLHIGTEYWYPDKINHKIKDELAWFIYKNLEIIKQ